MIRDLRSVIGWLPARERWRWLLLVPIAGLAALIEAAGALAVFGLLRLVVDPEQVRTAPVVSRLWAMWPTDPRSLVALLALGVGAFYVLRAVFLGWAEWTRQGIVYRSSAVAAERLLARYLAADYLFHARRRSASLIEPMARASDIAYELGAGSAVNILAEAVIILALAAVLIVSAPPITLVTVGVVLALVLVPIVLTRRSWERSANPSARCINNNCTCCSRVSARSRTSRSPAGSRFSKSDFAISSAISAPPSSAARGPRASRALASRRR